MIENFIHTSNTANLKVNLGVNVYLYEYNSQKDINSFYTSSEQGVKWTSNSHEIVISEKNQYLEAYSTCDLKKVIVVYPINHYKYPSPNNAVIYNEDGTFLKQLTPPKLISELAKKHYRTGDQSPGTINLLFRQANWGINSSGKVVTCIQIGFGRDYLEFREFNADTLEFGECLGSSMT